MLVIEAEPEDFPGRILTFRPLTLTARAAERARRLAVPRQPITFSPGWRARLKPSADLESWQEGGPAVEIDMRVGGERAYLRTNLSALEAFLYHAEPRVRIDDLDSELCASLIEAHVAEALDLLESEIGCQCSIERIAKVRTHDDVPRIEFGVSVDGAEDAHPAVLFASPRVLGLMAAAWEKRARIGPRAAETHFVLAARVAVSSVSHAGLRGLAVGDALLFDRVAPEGGIVLCLGEQLYTVGEIAESGDVIPGDIFSASSPLLLGEFLMSDDDFTADVNSPPALDEASIGSLPVRLVFELGRRNMSLDELRALGVGAPISLEKPASSVVDILANGRRVGAGEMVLIGDQLGVRITRLNGDA